jgi:hypothetical protein
VKAWLLANVTSAVDGGERFISFSFQFINAGIKLPANRLRKSMSDRKFGDWTTGIKF